MNCPACGHALAAGAGACAACGALAGLPVEGALAADPATHPVPSREPAGKRRREKERERQRHWKDEVRERMNRRREREGGAPVQPDLPFFREPGPPPTAAVRPGEPSTRGGSAPEALHRSGPPEDSAQPVGPTALGSEAEAPPPPLGGAEADDGLSLRVPGEHDGLIEPLPLRDLDAPGPRTAAIRPAAPLLGEGVEEPEATDGDWTLGEVHGPSPAVLVDRPALANERLQAALIDLGVLVALWAGVLYFASRAARVPFGGLQPAWPWLLGYMALLGLLYAAYFTGTTGQTLGKMLFGLRVVGRAGRAPGYVTALARAALGALGAAAVGLGLMPMLFDPARRALHDRLFGTRVVRPGPPTARLS